MKFICIDPGLGGTGWAIFNAGDKLLPEKTGVVHAAKGTWEKRTKEITDKLDKVSTVMCAAEIAFIELPAFFESTKGMACATGKNGGDSDLVKLSLLVGRLTDRLERRKLVVKYIRVIDWKHTMPKHIVAARIRSRLGEDFKYVNHSDDAVGMGLWVKNVFQANSV